MQQADPVGGIIFVAVVIAAFLLWAVAMRISGVKTIHHYSGCCGCVLPLTMGLLAAAGSVIAWALLSP